MSNIILIRTLQLHKMRNSKVFVYDHLQYMSQKVFVMVGICNITKSGTNWTNNAIDVLNVVICLSHVIFISWPHYQTAGKAGPICQPEAKMEWWSYYYSTNGFGWGKSQCLWHCQYFNYPIYGHFTTSTSASKHVLHLSQDALGRKDILNTVGNVLSTSLPVVIRGVAHETLHRSIT